MNAMSPEALDAEELMHLALAALDARRSDEALVFVKRAIAVDANDARLHYLLGALYASIGMLDRAIAATRRATELSGDLRIAQFQLGLLLMTRGELEQAQAAWMPLDALHDEHPLRVFKRGLVHLGRDEYEACAAEIRRGLALCAEESLNEEMRRLLEQVEASIGAPAAASRGDAGPHVAPTPAGDAAARPEPERRAAEHVLLAGYRPVTDASLLKVDL